MVPSHSFVHDFALLLFKCRRERSRAQALHLHDVFMKQDGLDVHGSQLVSVLVQLGSMHHARHVFDKMVRRDALSWNALIVGYVRHNEPQHALSLYQKMHQVREGPIHPSDYAFVALLKACATLKDLSTGCGLHMEAVQVGLLENNAFVGCSLVDMYAKCGRISTAHEIFKNLPIQDTVSWNALLTGYTDRGYSKEALDCFSQMQHEGVAANAVTFVCSLKACGSIGDIHTGQEIHAEVVRKGLELELTIGNTLVDMYARCGLLLTAKGIFEKLPCRDVISWNTLLGGLLEDGEFREALVFFQWMQQDGVSPSSITCAFVLKACSGVGTPAQGQEIHAEIVTRGLEREPLLGSSLIDMYAKCGLLLDAQNVLHMLPSRSVASWSALMAGYTEHGDGEKTLNCFDQMQNERISPDAFAFSCVLKACGSIGDTEAGQELHAEIVGKGLEKEILVGNTLVNMYVSLGFLATAQHVFDKLPMHNMVSLNALIIGYSERGCAEDVIHCFDKMLEKDIALNLVTVILCLKACCSIGSIMKGREIHGKVVETGLEQEHFVGNTLIDLYVKFSSLAEAQQVFDGLEVRDVISWTALMGGYAQLGDDSRVFIIFESMKEKGITPNSVTFVHVLYACNHAGLVKKGQSYFEAMSEEYGITPELDHYTSIIDLLGRAGHLDKAATIINKMPMQPDLVVWHIVLAACQKWANVELGQFAFRHAVKLDERAAATYRYMFDIYMDAGMCEEAGRIEALRRKDQAWSSHG